METDWCRVRQFYAGNGYGAVWVPDLGDEVLVAFIQGDMRQPIVLGGLYNGKDRPPAQDPRERMICSKNGHKLRFIDSTPTGGDRGALIIETGTATGSPSATAKSRSARWPCWRWRPRS
jgi:phage baseplate assembly protein V